MGIKKKSNTDTNQIHVQCKNSHTPFSPGFFNFHGIWNQNYQCALVDTRHGVTPEVVKLDSLRLARRESMCHHIRCFGLIVRFVFVANRIKQRNVVFNKAPYRLVLVPYWWVFHIGGCSLGLSGLC